MTDRDYERWIALQDREALGATLSVAERDFCAAMVADNPMCAREAALLLELENLSAEPDAGAREREDAVLAAVWNTHASDTHTATHASNAHATRHTQGSGARLRTLGKLSAVLAAAAAVALMIGGGVGYFQRANTAKHAAAHASRVELVYASGDVQIDARTATFGQLLSEGSVVQVNEGAACLAIDPGIDVCLKRGSSLRVTRTNAADRRVDLLDGTATASIAPQPAGARFSVVADDVWSTAVGTAFSVSRDKQRGVETVVLSGKVLVGAANKQQVVSAHQRAKTTREDKVHKTTVSAIARAEEAPHWAAIKTSELWRDPKTATLIVNDDDSHGDLNGDVHANLWLNGEEIGVSPLSSLIPAGEHRLTSVFSDGTTFEHSFMVATGKSWTLDLNAERANAQRTHAETDAAAAFKARVIDSPTRAKTKPNELSATAPSELLARVRQQLRTEQWQAAAATYRQLRAQHADSPEAKTVLVSLAQLSLEHLHNPAAALHDLDTYLSQGGGALNQEARYLRITALRQLGKTAVAQDAARAFLDDYPTSFQAAALRRTLNAANGSISANAPSAPALAPTP